MHRLFRRVCFACVLPLFSPLFAQEIAHFDAFCDYFSATPPPQLRLTPPDPGLKDQLSRLLSRSKDAPEVKIYAADIRAFAAARRGEELFLLYNPSYVQAQTQSGRLSPAALAILVHEVWHLSYKNGLTTEPGVRERMELLADEASGSAMRNLGVGESDAVAALAGLAGTEQGSLFPTVQQRREAIIEGWAPQNSASASAEAEHQKGMARPPAAADGHPKKARPPERDSAAAPPPPPAEPPSAAVPRPAAPASAEPDQPAEIPKFPWPPPEASAFARIPSRLLLSGAPANPHLRDAADGLLAALSHAGYTETSFYSVPEGFALASRMEQTDADGRPLPGNARWALSVAPERVFCLSCYLKALMTAHPGHFRVVVFIVSSRPFRQANTPVTAKVARDWLDSGMNSLPRSLGEQPFTADHVCTALIYEFELREGDSGAALKLPGTLTGATHLARAGIWPQLQN